MARPIQIRDFPDELRRELKMIAAQTDKPLRTVIIEALTDYVEKIKKRKK
jgi:predicted transcriptional regulator